MEMALDNSQTEDLESTMTTNPKMKMTKKVEFDQPREVTTIHTSTLKAKWYKTSQTPDSRITRKYLRIF